MKYIFFTKGCMLKAEASLILKVHTLLARIQTVLEKWVSEDMSVSEEELAGIGLPLLP